MRSTAAGVSARTAAAGVGRRDEHAGTHGPRRRVLGLGRIQRRGLDFGGGYTEIGEDFNPEVGFLVAARLQEDRGSRVPARAARGPRSLFEIRPHIVYRGYWDFEGFQETGFLHLDTHWELRSSREFHTG